MVKFNVVHCAYTLFILSEYNELFLPSSVNSYRPSVLEASSSSSETDSEADRENRLTTITFLDKKKTGKANDQYNNDKLGK